MIFSKCADVMLPEVFAPDSALRLEIDRSKGRMADWKAAFPLDPGETVKPLYGLFESDGHELDRFLEEKRREKAIEDGIDPFSDLENGGRKSW